MQEGVDLHQKILKPFDKFAVRVLSSLKHEAQPSVLNLIKHCCSFIIHYIEGKSLPIYKNVHEGTIKPRKIVVLFCLSLSIFESSIIIA